MSKGNAFDLATSQGSSTRRKTATAAVDREVQLSARLAESHRAALRAEAARYGLSISSAVSAFAMAAADGDERIHTLFEEYGDAARKPRGREAHQRDA